MIVGTGIGGAKVVSGLRAKSAGVFACERDLDGYATVLSLAWRRLINGHKVVIYLRTRLENDKALLVVLTGVYK